MAHYYVGLDVSMDQTDITTVDEKGGIVFEASVKTDPSCIDEALKRAGFSIEKMSMESGSLSHWLVQELSKLKWNVTCIDARSISPLLNLKTNKTDRNDARGIAEAVRTESKCIREVHQKSQESINIGTLLTARRLLVEQRTSLSNATRGLFKSFGIRLGPLGIESFASIVQTKISGYWPVESLLPEKNPNHTKQALYEKKPQVFALEALTTCFETLCQQINTIDVELNTLSKKDKIVKRLMTVPGIGPLTALTYKTTIDDPTRFKNPRLVGAYLGMRPTQYSSGQTKRLGRISKRGSKELRTLLASAGMRLLTNCKQPSDLRTWGLKIAEKHGKKKAFMAIGRKLAVIMHHI
ncbi:MAG: IS110 family transposase [Chlamydiota bacterium]